MWLVPGRPRYLHPSGELRDKKWQQRRSRFQGLSAERLARDCALPCARGRRPDTPLPDPARCVDRPTPSPDLVAWASDAQRVWVATSLPTLAARNRFILVAPDASLNRHWNDGRGTVGKGKPSSADDVAYLKLLITAIVAHDRGDPRHVFMVGVSNGGMMTMRFACEAGSWLRAGGNVVSNLPSKEVGACRHVIPLPWISINGTRDPRIPFQGYAAGTLINGRPQAGLESADATFTFFADRAGCAHSVKLETLPDIDTHDGATAFKRVREGCARGTTSTQYVLAGAGHNWPGLPIDGQRAQTLGPADQDVDAGMVIWEHFRQTLTQQH